MLLAAVSGQVVLVQHTWSDFMLAFRRELQILKLMMQALVHW